MWNEKTYAKIWYFNGLKYNATEAAKPKCL